MTRCLASSRKAGRIFDGAEQTRNPLCLLSIAIGLWIVLAAPLWALNRGGAQSESQLCDRAAAAAARESGVPVELLLGITRAETGRADPSGRIAPWPWTVNMEGQGRWFTTPREAIDYVLRHQSQGARSFDIGCFQVNHLWHGQHFANIETMFDPLENARYAARFLLELHGEFGNWPRAVGAYHSRTARHATRYVASVERHLDALLTPPQGAQVTRAIPEGGLPLPNRGNALEPLPLDRVRVNTYPLLQQGIAPNGAMGSLVPQNQTAASSLFGG